MKLVKLFTVPAVLLISLLMAVPASAHGLQGATVGVNCGKDTQAGQICVTLTGDIEQSNDERFVFFDVYAKGSDTSLGEISFDIPAFKPGGDNHFSQTICFPPITNSNATSFTVKVVKVTSDAAGKLFSDLALHLPKPIGDVTFTTDNQLITPVAVGDTEKCVAPVPASAARSTSPGANTTVALAQTGGFDFRFPLIGLTVLVAGLALFLVSSSRGRRSTGDK